MLNKANNVAEQLRDELILSKRVKRMKVKTLMNRFDYQKRTEDCSTRITEILSEMDVIINPSIMKTGDFWLVKLSDQVQLSLRGNKDLKLSKSQSLLSETWNQDLWFDTLPQKKFRTEREVETKLVIPLLTRLGYTEDDRYDGMPVNASHGSKQTRLETDFALYNSESLVIKSQVLLIVEVKKCKSDNSREVELENTRNQVKSYSFWVSCHYGLITDGNRIEVIDLFPSVGYGGKRVCFSCEITELKSDFKKLYNLISKEKLTNHYEILLT